MKKSSNGRSSQRSASSERIGILRISRCQRPMAEWRAGKVIRFHSNDYGAVFVTNERLIGDPLLGDRVEAVGCARSRRQ